jgi:polyisoprenoid-binding protein YceI
MKLLLLTLLISTGLFAKSYNVDTKKSEVTFNIYKYKIDELISGKFNVYSASYELNGQVIQNIKATVKVTSVDTQSEKRDNHLRSPDFFDVEKYPNMTFVSKDSATFNAKGKASIKGDLTIKAKTLNVILVLTKKEGVITAKTTIDRYKYGVNWNARIDKKEESFLDMIAGAAKGLIGKYVVGNDVNIVIKIN